MIWVIAVSTTVEYGLKSLYETLLGNFTDTGASLTEEDKFNARYTQSYVDFIETTPWYDFDFMAQLKNLWANTSLSGDHLIRKLERRYYLTTELLIKAGYGWLIGLGTESAYEEALLNTAVILDKPFVKGDDIGGVKSVKILESRILTDFPRYAPFKEAAIAAAYKGINFKEIAGNRSAILLTVLTKEGKNIGSPDVKLVFTQPILTQPGMERIAIVTTVPKLSAVLRSFEDNGIVVEHIYDY